MVEQWIIDASMGYQGAFCFCPIEGDINGGFKVVVGMNYLSNDPPPGGPIVAILHSGGDKEVEKFCAQHTLALVELKRKVDMV